jgi:DNA replication protein DnaC
MLKVERNINLLDWGFPRKFLDAKWNINLIKNEVYYPQIEKYMKDFDDNYLNGRGLFLYGSEGRGKTTISCIIAKYAASKMNPYSFEKKTKFTAAYSQLDSIMSLILNDRIKGSLFISYPDLLIIDNIGEEFGRNENKFSQRTLDNIIRQRDNDKKPLILCSKYNISDIEIEYSKEVKEFIEYNNEIVEVSGINHRIIEKPEF